MNDAEITLIRYRMDRSRGSSGQTYCGTGFSEQELDKDRQAFKRNGTVIQHAFR